VKEKLDSDHHLHFSSKTHSIRLPSLLPTIVVRRSKTRESDVSLLLRNHYLLLLCTKKNQLKETVEE
jgi:hypothetical protein